MACGKMAVSVKYSSKEDASDQVEKIKKRKKTCKDNDITAESLHHRKGTRKKRRTSDSKEQNDSRQGEKNTPEESVEHPGVLCEDSTPEMRLSKKRGKKCKKRRQQQEEEEPDQKSMRRRKDDGTKAVDGTADPVAKNVKKKKENKTMKLADCRDVLRQEAKLTAKGTGLEEMRKNRCGLGNSSSEDPNRQGKKKKMRREDLSDGETLANSSGFPDTNGAIGHDSKRVGVEGSVVRKRKIKSKKAESERGNHKGFDITDERDDLHPACYENSATVKCRKKEKIDPLRMNSNGCTGNLKQRKRKKTKRRIIGCDNAEDKADDGNAQKSKMRKTKHSDKMGGVTGEEENLLIRQDSQPRAKGKKKESSAGVVDDDAASKPNKRKQPRKSGNVSPAASESLEECRAGTRSKGSKKHGKAGGKKNPDVHNNLADNKQTDGSRGEQVVTKKSKLVRKLERDAVDNDVIFVSKNPGNVEKNFDLAKRVALQTQVDIMTGKVSLDTNKTKGDGGGSSHGGSGGGVCGGSGGTAPITARATQFGQWNTACLGDAAKQNKFLRLMGGFKNGPGHSGSTFDSSPGESGRANMALSSEGENRLKSALESQFQQALRRKNHQQRGVGLGFQTNAGAKNFFIDKSTSRSIKLD